FADEPKPSPIVPVAGEDPPPPPVPAAPGARGRAGADNRDARGWVSDAQPVPVARPAWAEQNILPAPFVDDLGRARLKDEVELLEAQMNVKQAHVRAAERGVKAAATGLDRVKNLRDKGVVSSEQISNAEEAYEKAVSELEIRQAELKEHAVRMAQAKRRM